MKQEQKELLIQIIADDENLGLYEEPRILTVEAFNKAKISYKEPKQDEIMERFIANAKQQETLEEAAVINYKKLYEGEPLTQDVPIDAFKEGAKWQQERSYSEEEAQLMLSKLLFDIKHKKAENSVKWFEQNKKE